ncbi:hypothetical protein [Shewanella sp. UCD-KL12]|uniref:hypothetical protein n=1 Tax=Shewanella sp. UCD-KL12 TaxID=1917163 RepID=UPI000970E148|nr:hypothetical protein [Shewanella sp. UCD-KL12]
MKKVILAGLVSCLFVGSAHAEYLEQDVAIGMASLMICSTFYSENDMLIEGTIVGQSATSHRKAGIEEMMMTVETGENLDKYIAAFQSSSKEQKLKVCNEAIEFARVSDFVK